MRVHILTEHGIQAFRDYLNLAKTDPTLAVPWGLLTDPAAAVALDQAIEVETRPFATRLEAAEYLATILPGVRNLNYNAGLWSWLALFYFDQVCPVENGTRFIGEEARYIPGTASWRYYRHLLAGPYRIYQNHQDNARLLLSGPVHRPGDFMEQLASRQEFITNPGIIGAATLLYYDDGKQRPKRGAASTKRKAGTLRRFVDVVQQLDLTYDLYSMTPDEIVTTLPNEFSSWHNQAAGANS